MNVVQNRLDQAKIPINPARDLVFQAISWHAEDVDFADIDGEGEASRYKDFSRYVIKCFGVDEDGRTVSVSIQNFKPYFYIKIDEAWSVDELRLLKNYLVSTLPAKMAHTLTSVEMVMKKEFWGFTDFRDFKFAKLSFKSHKAMKFINYKIQNSTTQPLIIPSLGKYTFKTYESNIDPFIRFLHENNIEPVGWIRLPGGTYNRSTDVLPSTSQIDVETKWKNVVKHESVQNAPFLIASFDIECMSKTGDFPVPIKDFKKLATQIYELFLFNIRKEICEYDKVLVIQNAIHYAFGIPPLPSQKSDIDSFAYPLHIHKLEFKDPNFSKQMVKRKMEESIEHVMTILNGKSARLVEQRKKDQDEFEKQKSFHIICELTDCLNHMYLPQLEGDPIIQIGTTFHTYGSRECCYRHIVTLGKTDSIPGIEVECCDSEEELLHKWQTMINRINPDIMTGYNIFGFDFVYLYERAIDLGITTSFMQIGRFKDVVCRFKENKLSSSALGDNILKFIDMHGRVLIDMMKVIQRDHKLDMYSLNNVSKHFMGMQKNDVSPQDIFRLQEGDSADRSVVAKYCVQDCELCNNLMIKLEIIANNMGMANVCLVPLSFIFMRGQGIKIFSLVLKQCKDNNYVIPVMKKSFGEEMDVIDEMSDSFEGAIVLEPKEGIYIDDPVSVMDYSSLYPSSMISENLSHDCLVIDPKYDNLPGVKYNDICYDKYVGKGDNKRKVGVETCRFVEMPNNEKGIVPRILQKLLMARKSTRKRIESKSIKMKNGDEYTGIYQKSETIEEGSCFGYITNHLTQVKTKICEQDILSIEDEFNDFQKAVLDGLQNAYKVTANSLYGQMGASTSQLYLKEIAACTTATGRNMILKAKDFLEKNYDGNVVYGDSVTSYTPVYVKDQDDVIDLCTIESLADKYGNSKWIPCSEAGRQTKEACELPGIQTWTENGWTPMNRVIRHLLAPHKKIVRVLTHTGVVDVTDDHSLLDPQGNPVTSKNISIGTPLLHHPSPTYRSDDLTFSEAEAEAEVMGFFYGNGSCGYHESKSCKKASWALHNSDEDLLKKYVELCKVAYPDISWVVMRTKRSSSVDKISPRCDEMSGKIVDFVQKYRSLMYDEDSKMIPRQILNAPLHIKQAFWRGLCDADGDNDEHGYTRIDQKSMLSASHIALLASQLGRKVSIKCLNTRIDKPHIFRVTITTQSQRKSPTSIKKMYEIPYDGYVYDLTTENHHFAAGVGQLILHNTDSVFVIFPNKDEDGNRVTGHPAVMKSINTAIEASDKFSPLIKKPHNLEYEKTFWPFILLSKKRYVGNLYEMDDVKFKQKSMGIVLKRRDNAPIVKTIYGGIIDIILNKKDIAESVRFLRKSLDDLVSGSYPIEALVITKSLRANYKNPLSIAHKVLADRMAERDPGDKPQVNDRIPYVYVQMPNSKKKTLQGERIEHPDYVKKNNVKIDYNFYLTNQIMKPINQVYGIIVEQLPENTKTAQHYKEMWTVISNEEKISGNTKKIKEKYMIAREKEAQAILFDPYIKAQEFILKKNHTMLEYFPSVKDAPHKLLPKPANVKKTEGEDTRASNKGGDSEPRGTSNKAEPKGTSKKAVQKESVSEMVSKFKSDPFLDDPQKRRVIPENGQNGCSTAESIQSIAVRMKAEKKTYKQITEHLGITMYRLKKILE